jgi:hypothetical protein
MVNGKKFLEVAKLDAQSIAFALKRDKLLSTKEQTQLLEIKDKRNLTICYNWLVAKNIESVKRMIQCFEADQQKEAAKVLNQMCIAANSNANA